MTSHHRFIRLLGTLLLLVLSATGARADDRIFVIADAHVMAPSLLDSPGNKAWRQDAHSKKVMQEHSAAIFDQICATILNEHPTVVLFAGDLTKDGEKESHEYVINNLTKIQQAGIPVYVIPGNHDRGFMEDAKRYANETSTPAEQIDNDLFASLYHDFGYGGDNVRRRGTSLTYAADILPGVTLIGVDTGIWCTVSDETLECIGQQADDAHSQGRKVLLMSHHSLMPHYQNQNSLLALSVPANYPDILSTLTKHGIQVVLSGHTHASDIARYTDAEGHILYDIATGCPISYPCDYRVLTLSNDRSRLAISTRSITQLEGYGDFPKYASERAYESITNWATDWLSDKVSEQYIILFVAPQIANCFLVFAIGNEPENEQAANLKETFRMAAEEAGDNPLLQVITPAFTTMLGDYQSPDDPDNVVNDRTLTIFLSTPDTGIQERTADKTDDGPWFTLQGTRLSTAPTRPGTYIHNSHIYIKK